MERQEHMIDREFWKGKKVFITGHTGFKGSWLCLWLHQLGACVTGYSLEPPTTPSLFKLAGVDKLIASINGDVRDRKKLAQCVSDAKPEIVFHLAAQPLVRDSYKIPVDTYEINVMGTVNILESIRLYRDTVRAFVNVTTDKVYENREWLWGYRENEPLGGYDPYSNSKACSELVTAAYRNSYFNSIENNKVGIATARAGNVIGGGDWALDRIVPDCIRALLKSEPVLVRNPHSIRPWQHVLDPLSGYLLLCQKLCEQGQSFTEAWNFGPDNEDAVSVAQLVQILCEKWGKGASYNVTRTDGPHEAAFLKLDCTKTTVKIGWLPKWSVTQAVDAVVNWTKRYSHGDNIQTVCLDQLEQYQSTAL